VASTRAPIRPTSGRNAFARKSNGGELGLCVPPSSTSDDGWSAVSRLGSTVWRTSVALPAVPTENVYSPAFTVVGAKVRLREPTAAPVVSAAPTAAAASTAVRC
jgi:hypothetical protein